MEDLGDWQIWETWEEGETLLINTEDKTGEGRLFSVLREGDLRKFDKKKEKIKTFFMPTDSACRAIGLLTIQ